MEDVKPGLEAVVFDLDDTLIPCKMYYVQARAELLVWMSEVFEPMLSENFGMKKGSLVEKARSVQRRVKKEGIFTRDVHEIIDDFFQGDEAGSTAWDHLKGALDLYSESRQTESLTKRTRRLQEPGLIVNLPYLNVGLELLRHSSSDSIPAFVLAAMANAFKIESKEDYHEFKKEGKQFSTERTPMSCKKTYVQMSELLGTAPEWEHIHKAAAIGRKAFEITDELMPGAENMLDYLKLLDMKISLLTRGPEDKIDNVQWLKYHINRLDRWIPEDSVTITTVKSPEHYAKLIGEVCPEKSLVIGNDFDNDVQPARQLGMHSIWIPLETWSMDSSDSFGEGCGQAVEGGLLRLKDDRGLYTFVVESAERVPALLAEYFSR